MTQLPSELLSYLEREMRVTEVWQRCNIYGDWYNIVCTGIYCQECHGRGMWEEGYIDYDEYGIELVSCEMCEGYGVIGVINHVLIDESELGDYG